MKTAQIPTIARFLSFILLFVSVPPAVASDCKADFAETRFVGLAGGSADVRCGDNCRLLPNSDASGEAGARLRLDLKADDAAARLWVRYRSSAASGVPITVTQDGAKAVRTLPASAPFRWEPVALPDRGTASNSLKTSPVELSLPQSASQSVECIMQVRSDGPLPGISGVVEVDRVWTGSRVAFDAVADGGLVFVGYYDAERYLNVARVNIQNGEVQRQRLPERFEGWDTHNAVHLALDRSNQLHVAGNMHGSPLVYYRTKTPGEIGSLARATMVGRQEDQVTYPTFLRGEGGRMVFLYRDGVSGDGAWIANVEESGSWRRLSASPLFADADESGPVSAYPSEFVSFPDGTVRVAVMWRRPGEVARNFRVTYHVTRDFRSWSRADGRIDKLPLSPSTGDRIDDSGENAGLLNTHHLAAAPDGVPAITFTKYAAGGNNGAYLSTLRDSTWRTVELAVAPRRTTIDNAGIARSAPGVGPVEFDAKAGPHVDIGFPGVPYRSRVKLDAKTLAPVSAAEPSQLPVSSNLFGAPPDGLVSPSLMLKRVDGEADGSHLLFWRAQGQFGDKPRACTPSEPKACAPPPDILRLITLR